LSSWHFNVGWTDGVIEGFKEGNLEGFCDGVLDVIWVGLCNGMILGDLVAATDGIVVFFCEGRIAGIDDGALVLGCCVGKLDGLFDGELDVIVGDKDGKLVDLLVCSLVGIDDTWTEGLPESNSDGLLLSKKDTEFSDNFVDGNKLGSSVETESALGTLLAMSDFGCCDIILILFQFFDNK